MLLVRYAYGTASGSKSWPEAHQPQLAANGTARRSRGRMGCPLLDCRGRIAAPERAVVSFLYSCLLANELFLKSSTIDFALCLGATSSEKYAARTRPKKDRNDKSGNTQDHAALEKKDEVVANVIWRFLELRGSVIINYETHDIAAVMLILFILAYVELSRIMPAVVFTTKIMQVPHEFSHAWPPCKSDVRGDQAGEGERQIPRLSISVPGAGQGGCDARPSLVQQGFQWWTQFRNR